MKKVVQLGQPKNFEPLSSRVNGIKDSMIAAHKAGKGSPNEVIGNEREVFVRNYLESAYPKPFRFSTGFIIDKKGKKSGQLDIVVEKLYSISIPISASTSERLHIAEMVSAVISVKSNLFSQWYQIESEVDKLSEIESISSATFRVNNSDGLIPFFIVAYSGAKKIEILDEKLSSIPNSQCIRAIIVLDSNLFAVQTKIGCWKYCENDSSFLYFISELHDVISRNIAVGENMWEYACEVTDG